MLAKKVKVFCLAPTNRTIARGQLKRHHGISCFNYYHTILSALHQNLSEASLTSLLSVAQASKNSSTDRLHFRQTATHWWARSRACLACGRLVQLWPACHRVAAWVYLLPTGWCMATQALTFGVWMSRVTATSQLLSSQMQKFARTIHDAFALPSLTKN